MSKFHIIKILFDISCQTVKNYANQENFKPVGYLIIFLKYLLKRFSIYWFNTRTTWKN